MNSLDERYLCSGKYILGIKGIPLNTEVLLFWNEEDKTLDFIYASEGDNKTIKIPFDDVRDIKYESKVTVSDSRAKPENHETTSMLLSAITFGGNPILQVLGNSGYNALLNGLSNNYDKMTLHSYFDVILHFILNGEEKEVIIETFSNPKDFCKLVND